MKNKKLEKLRLLNKFLLAEMPDIKIENERGHDLTAVRNLFHALMNVRPPMPLDKNFLKLQDEILSEEVKERGVVKISEIPDFEKNIKLWQGDITRLEVDAIVNAANSALLGCFIPLHKCIDNAIHSVAGLQLRDACAKISDGNEPTGQAKITPAFNLPSKFVIHTVGPIIPMNREPNQTEKNLLASCYESCLNLAKEKNLHSIAFCCISTGEFHFPNELAAKIAIETVKRFLSENKDITIIFNVFKDLDLKIYKKKLKYQSII